MSSGEHPRTSARSARSSLPAGALVVVTLVLIGALGHQALTRSTRSSSSFSSPASLSSSSSPSPSRPLAPSSTVRSGPRAAASAADTPLVTHLGPGGPADPPPIGRQRALGGADGAVPDGATVFDHAIPAVANLDAALLGALRLAATDAAGDGVTFAVTSGWRSPAYQEQLLDEAVATHGSEAEAARWVATPDRSAHVSGDAVDVGTDAADWLARHGAAYGLCAIYDNEPWHHELRPDAVHRGCPARYPDPTHDPRMQP